MRLLVLAPRAIGAEDVRAALPHDDLSGAEVLVVSPAPGEAAVAFSMGDAGGAVEGAATRTARELQAAGAGVRATGDDDPLLVLHDALAGYPADRLLLFDDGLAAEARDRFDLPVTHGHLRG